MKCLKSRHFSLDPQSPALPSELSAIDGKLLCIFFCPTLKKIKFSSEILKTVLHKTCWNFIRLISDFGFCKTGAFATATNAGTKSCFPSHTLPLATKLPTRRHVLRLSHQQSLYCCGSLKMNGKNSDQIVALTLRAAKIST